MLGARTRAQLEESLGALEVELEAEALARIARALPPVAGTRYDERQMKVLDSEK